MGKGTDKLYITQSEWASEDAFSASAGAGVNKSKASDASFKRLPFNFCAVSLQPFKNPVCTLNGTIFDLEQILNWLEKHATNPVDGSPLEQADLFRLNFAKNEEDEFVDPVTFKPLTDNTHIVALKPSGNIFAYDTVERLNIKAKNWRDLVTDDEFSRKDIITLQDPQNLASRDFNSFKYVKDGLKPAQDEQPTSNVNSTAMGSSAKIIQAREAVARARAERKNANDPNRVLVPNAGTRSVASSKAPPKTLPSNAAKYTTGQAAASFTSTGLTPHTSNERAILSEEEYMLKPRMVKEKGYAQIQTNLGNLNIELETEYAPKAVWNFVHLAKKGYYNGVNFHRSIRSFMLQGGDPTGTGRGGQSIWGKPFADEFAQSPLTHNSRGVLSMANKGKNTNTSQFFVTYRPTPHLDRKHTIFGKLLDMDKDGESAITLDKLERVKTEDDKPVEECSIKEIAIFVDPFEEFQKSQTSAKQNGNGTDADEALRDDSTTWTGKRVRGVMGANGNSVTSSVGKYLDTSAVPQAGSPVEEEQLEEWDVPVEEPAPKRRKAGGFGNFDNW